MEAGKMMNNDHVIKTARRANTETAGGYTAQPTAKQTSWKIDKLLISRH